MLLAALKPVLLQRPVYELVEQYWLAKAPPALMTAYGRDCPLKSRMSEDALQFQFVKVSGEPSVHVHDSWVRLKYRPIQRKLVLLDGQSQPPEHEQNVCPPDGDVYHVLYTAAHGDGGGMTEYRMKSISSCEATLAK